MPPHFSNTALFIRLCSMRLNFFCDIDGTLLPFGKTVPQSAVEAIGKARMDGHRFFLSTGRSPVEVDPRLNVIVFDGGVYSNGATAVFHGKNILDLSMTEDDVKFLLDYSERNGFMAMIQTDYGTYLRKETKDFFYSSMEAASGHPIDVPNLIVFDSRPSSFPVVRKFLFLSPLHQLDISRRDLADKYQIIDNAVGLPQTDMVEVCIKDLNKGTGIVALMKALKENIDSTVGIGDGSNDKEMLSSVGLGIAMGNASDDVKKIADWVSDDVDNDGFKRAVEYATQVFATARQ